MAVTLRVVGIFYKTSIEFDAIPGARTVKDVMDAAVAQGAVPRPEINRPGTQQFSYTFQPAIGPAPGSMALSPSMIRAEYSEPFTSNSGKSYAAGVFDLLEDPNNPGMNFYSIWQYYLFNAEDGQESFRNEFVPFNDTGRAVVQDGWTVIWRLVTIRKPIGGLMIPEPMRYQQVAANTTN